MLAQRHRDPGGSRSSITSLSCFGLIKTNAHPRSEHDKQTWIRKAPRPGRMSPGVGPLVMHTSRLAAAEQHVLPWLVRYEITRTAS